MTVKFLMMWAGARAMAERASGSSEEDCAARVMMHVLQGRELPRGGDALGQLFLESLFMVRWAANGFPQCVMGHRLAASLMASRVPMECAHDVALPWDAFVVGVPSGLVNASTGSFDMMCVMRHQSEQQIGDQKLRFALPGDASRDGKVLSLWSYAGLDVLSRSVMSLVEIAEYDATGATDFGSDIAGKERDRALPLLSRLLLGVCIEMDRPKVRVEIGEGRPKAKQSRSGLPKAWTFALSRDVKVDCRDWVMSVMRGERGTATAVQTMVRGHHRRQPFGSGSIDRKWIHIEPYWRGPEDGPIAVRDHQLIGKSARAEAVEQEGAQEAR